jgi:hypothetical protein
MSEKMRAVQVDLTLRLPKPDEVHSHDQRDNQPSVNSVPETYRHPER